MSRCVLWRWSSTWLWSCCTMVSLSSRTPARLCVTHCWTTYVMSLIIDFSENDSRHTFVVCLSVFAASSDDSVMHLGALSILVWWWWWWWWCCCNVRFTYWRHIRPSLLYVTSRQTSSAADVIQWRHSSLTSLPLTSQSTWYVIAIRHSTSVDYWVAVDVGRRAVSSWIVEFVQLFESVDKQPVSHTPAWVNNVSVCVWSFVCRVFYVNMITSTCQISARVCLCLCLCVCVCRSCVLLHAINVSTSEPLSSEQLITYVWYTLFFHVFILLHFSQFFNTQQCILYIYVMSVCLSV